MLISILIYILNYHGFICQSRLVSNRLTFN